MSSILEVDGLRVRFGAVVAVDSVSLRCEAGHLTGLIGPNGAGKTTFIDAVTGFVRATGVVRFGGTDVCGLAAHRIARTGMRRTWQSLELFDDISVRANLQVAVEPLTLRSAVRDYLRPRERDQQVDEVLDLLEMGDLAERQPRELSQGQRKLLGVARALVARPQMLLLDEPAAGLDREETDWLGLRLRSLVDGGQSMLMVDHDMRLVLSVCDRVHVLESGGLIASGPPEEIRADERVRAAYLGTGDGSEPVPALDEPATVVEA